MDTDTEPRWLSPDEDHAWRSLWATMTWLPARLDSQLRRDADLSLAEYHALSQISEAPGGAIRLSELAEVTNMTLSHLSRVISRMMRAGWVTRTPDPSDGRYTLGSLTDAGWEKVRTTAPGHVEAVRSAIFDRLTPEQIQALGDIAATIATNVGPTGAEWH